MSRVHLHSEQTGTGRHMHMVTIWLPQEDSGCATCRWQLLTSMKRLQGLQVTAGLCEMALHADERSPAQAPAGNIVLGRPTPVSNDGWGNH